MQATLALLTEGGYDRLTIDAVAARAEVGKASIYRRWPSKAEMVVDAIRTLNPAPEFPDTGSLRGDLIDGLNDFFNRSEGIGLVLGIASALPRHPELRQLLNDRFRTEQGERHLAVFQRAMQRGEIHEQCNAGLLAAVLRGVIFDQLLLNDQAIRRDFIIDIVDEVIVPLATSPAAAGADGNARSQ